MKAFTLVIGSGILLATSLHATEKVLFSQDFESSTLTADYVGAGRGCFDVIGVLSSGETKISQGRLSFGKGADGKATAFAVRQTPLGKNPGALHITFDLFVAPHWQGTGSGAFSMSVGQDFKRNGNTVSPGAFGQIQIALDDSPAYRVFDPLTRESSRKLRAGETVRITWVLNRGANAVSYQAPGGSSVELPGGATDLWVDDLLTFKTLPARAPANEIHQVAFGLGGSIITESLFLVDNLVITQLSP